MVTDEPRGMWPAALPWNTTRTMAEVLAEQDAADRRTIKQIGRPAYGPPRRDPPPVEVKAPYAGTEKKRYVLRALDGAYLHQSCAGMTKNQSFAWRGTHSQLERVQPKFPDLIASEVA